MKRINKDLIYLVAVLFFMTFPAICHAEYYWTIHKSAEKNMVTIPMGEQVEILYSVVVGVVEDDVGDCIDCAITARLDQCVLISEADGAEIGRVCARRNMPPSTFRYVGTIGPYDECGYYTVKNSVFLKPVSDSAPAEEECCDTWTIYVKVACDAPSPEQYQGCSQGYWKNHLASWLETGYEPDDLIGDVFTMPESDNWYYNYYFDQMKNDTLLDALNYHGGPYHLFGSQILLRKAVAALLNASHPAIYYPATPERIILNVNDALETLDRKKILSLKDKLENYNNMGCPLNGGDDDD